MNTHLMLDFETLGNTPNTVVLSLGAVLFTAGGIKKKAYWTFKLDRQFKRGRIASGETIMWWMAKEKAAQSVFIETRKGIHLTAFAKIELPEFLADTDPTTLRVWGNGATFDIPIVEHILAEAEKLIPWAFWNHRCYRTFKNLFPIEKTVKREGTHHNALDDSIYQATCLIEHFKKHPEHDK